MAGDPYLYPPILPKLIWMKHENAYIQHISSYIMHLVLTQETPCLTLMGELWGVFCKYFGNYWPCYDGTICMYVSFPMLYSLCNKCWQICHTRSHVVTQLINGGPMAYLWWTQNGQLMTHWLIRESFSGITSVCDFGTVKPVYNDHPKEYFSAFWSSSRWPRAT